MRLALCLCLGVCLAAGDAGAAAPRGPSKAKKLIETAIKLYDDLEYEKALEVLKKARRAVRTPDEGVEVDLYEGIFDVLLGREKDAVLAFTRALMIKPQAILPIRVSPKVQTTFDDVRAQRGLISTEPTPAPEPAPAPPPVVRAPEPAAAPAPGPGPAPASAATAVAEAPPAPTGSMRPLAIIPALAGAALAGVGIGFCVVAKSQYDRLETEVFLEEDAAALRDTGKLHQGLGVAGIAVGGAALIAAAVILIAGGPREAPPVALAPVPGGAVLTLGAPLP